MKYDGFRALAHIDGRQCRLVSRRGHVFGKFNLLAEEIAHSVRADRAILDGEIVCLAPDGRSRFYDLMFRRDWPHFVAFDVLGIDGEELTGRSLTVRKRRLRSIMLHIDSRLRYLDHVRGCGVDLVDRVCRQDCEGIVAKWARGRYHTDGVQTSWFKIKNPGYSQMTGRRELFERRQDPRRRTRGSPRPVLCPELAEVASVL